MDNDRETLLHQARSGDITAFHQLYLTFQDQLKSYLYRLLADRNDVEDLAQDTLIRSFDKIATFNGNEPQLKYWVFKIATNLALNFLKKRKRWELNAQDICRNSLLDNPGELEHLVSKSHFSPHGHYEIKEHIDYCFTCVTKTLPLEQQIALLLKDIYGFKIKEISSIMDRSAGVVKHLLHQARHTMQKIFEGRCALINQHGICYQCSELNGLFNPHANTQRQLMRLEMVKNSGSLDQRKLYQLRAEIVKAVDPLNANGAELHEGMIQHLKEVNQY